ncbi:MAG: hypothetical protein Q4B48_01785 [Syntrophomonadaceae bacterium]|nr:hypothetical protein [Syntrophomonadaceae bacterium]
MISTFALHPAASKALIAKAVLKLPLFARAYAKGRIFFGRGSGNAAILKQLLGEDAPPPVNYVSGMIAQNSPCSASGSNWTPSVCLFKGERWYGEDLDFLRQFEPGDVFIKGANAIDPEGRVGILIGHPEGGGIGLPYGILKAQGIPIICPVGLEKLIPSCPAAAKGMGILNAGPRLGMRLGYIVLDDVLAVTEIESIRLLYGLDATMIAGGGIGGMEGAVMLSVESDDEALLTRMVRDMKALNRTPASKLKKKACAECVNPCIMMTKQ